MPYDKPIIQTSNPYQNSTISKISRTIYYGEVISIEDDTEGGRIKARILDLDNKTQNSDLPWCYPLLPKFFHLYPKVGEVVRIFIEDIKFPQKSRFWIGSIISQLQKIEYDTYYTALSTTNVSLTSPSAAINTFPEAKGVFPSQTDIGLIGRLNTDIILKSNNVEIRAGKHDNGNVYKLNIKNPASISLMYEIQSGSSYFYSNNIIMADKIALISHTGKPQFKAAQLTPEDRIKIFKEGHPIARADVLVEALNIIRKALINHIHGYSTLAADKTSIINDLESIDFNSIMQKNVVTN